MSVTIEHIEGHSRPERPGQSPVVEVSDGSGRVVVSSWVDEATAELLNDLAEIDGVTRSTLVRESLQAMVARRTVVRAGHRVPRKGTSSLRRVAAA